MSLIVSLQHWVDGSRYEDRMYSLKAESVTHTQQRSATQTGLPGDPASSNLNMFGLDLGICVESIMISGIVDDVPETGQPSKLQLETAVQSWWIAQATTQDDAVSNSIYLKISSDCVYWGIIQSCTFRQMGGLEDRWEYELSFLIIARSLS